MMNYLTHHSATMLRCLIASVSFAIFASFLAASLSAKTVYISQSGAGSANGTSSANAYALTWLNTAGNWGTGVGQINPGDTITLEGAITSPITIAASGTAGHVTTLLFDTGAYMSRPYWVNGLTAYDGWDNVGNIKQGAIMAGNLSYFTIDGGTNGFIECADNGQTKTTQWDCAGIFIQSPQYVTIQNLLIKNLYTRTTNQTTPTMLAWELAVMPLMFRVLIVRHQLSTAV